VKKNRSKEWKDALKGAPYMYLQISVCTIIATIIVFGGAKLFQRDAPVATETQIPLQTATTQSSALPVETSYPPVLTPTELPVKGIRVEVEQMKNIGRNSNWTVDELYQQDLEDFPVFLLASDDEYIAIWQELAVEGLPEGLVLKGVYFVWWNDFRLYEVDPQGQYQFEIMILDPLLYFRTQYEENGNSFFDYINVNPVLAP
jgi:hypothetical protein